MSWRTVVISSRSKLDYQPGYMSLVREHDREKLFISVNMRSYYTDEQMNTFLRTLLGHDYRVVLIESVAREKLSDTKRIILDKDLCEI